MEITVYIDTNYTVADVENIVIDRVNGVGEIEIQPSKERVFGRGLMRISISPDSYQLASEIGYICALINSGQIKWYNAINSG